MKEETVQEIIECFQGDRNLFYYFKDRYALMLLSYLVDDAAPVSQLKSHRFAKLLKKPIINNILKHSGNGILTRNDIASAWPRQYECYLLTLGKWGETAKGTWAYNQTSRPGMNLVLQLNFSGRHNRSYYKLIAPESRHPFEYSGHPISEGIARTLAWSRIDIDFDNDEALIEEIQNDWIRIAMRKRTVAQRIARHSDMDRQAYIKRLGCSPESLLTYFDEVLVPHIRLWDEAILSASIRFLKKEIGIRKIYYHTFKTGCELKRIGYCKPPKSLYSRLPSRFCFQETRELPALISTQKAKRMKGLIRKKNLTFYLLEV